MAVPAMLGQHPTAPRPSVTDQVFDELQRQVMTLELAPGTRISEVEVAKTLDVSRQPVRDAFYRLSKLGFLVIRPQRATTVSLISPAFMAPAGGATLTFQQFIDTDEGEAEEDAGSIRILDADNSDALIAEIASDIKGISAGWTSESYPLPAGALGKNIKIEFRFVSNDNGEQFAGFYVDDVQVTGP